jgi:hypothetical protein
VLARYLFHFAYFDPNWNQPKSADTGNLWSDVSLGWLLLISDGGQTDELVAINADMLEKMIKALHRNSKEPGGVALKRVVLQTGTKAYGVHLGPIKEPANEDDPNPEGDQSFYVGQQKVLDRLSPELGFDCMLDLHNSANLIFWIGAVTRPAYIIGAPDDLNSLNVGLNIGLYLAVCKEVSPGMVQSSCLISF